MDVAIEHPARIVKILPLSDLMRAISLAAAELRGRYPSRIVACPMQIQKWIDDADRASRWFIRDPDKTCLTIMGVPVVEGAKDCTPELIWASPILGST